MMKYLRWLLWTLWYLPQPRPRRLNPWLPRSLRCRKPWAKFRPSVWRNDGGREWEICLDDEPSYTIPAAKILVDLQIGRESGKIVGLDISDSLLNWATPGTPRTTPPAE